MTALDIQHCLTLLIRTTEASLKLPADNHDYAPLMDARVNF